MASEEETDAKDSDDQNDDTRQFGVELGRLDDELESHDYPATSHELVEEFGDYEIELPNGSQTVQETLGLLEENVDEFEDAEEVRQAIYNTVGSEAVGREGYSDRGGANQEDDGDDTRDAETL